MSLQQQLLAELANRVGLSATAPETIALRDTSPQPFELAIEVTAVDRLSCVIREMRLQVPSLLGANFSQLKQWADNLCNRITYLLENIGPLELDPDGGRVLIRSTPPDTHAGATKFYEMVLQSHSGGNFSLRRYRSEKGSAGREQVDMHITQETLGRLVSDLVDSLPA